MRHTTEELRALAPKLRERGFYVPQKEQRALDWDAYTANQINDILDTVHFIRDEVDKVHTPTTMARGVVGRPAPGRGRPATDEGVLAKILLFVELFHIPERKAEGWALIIGPHLGIWRRIDDRVIGKAYAKVGVRSILHAVFRNNTSSDGRLSGDGTGLENSRKQNYECTKTKDGDYMTSIVDSREIVQAFDTGGTQECRIMHALVRELREELKKPVNRLLAAAQISLDAGFVDRKLAQLIEDAGMQPLIFPKKNSTVRAKGCPAWRRMVNKLLDGVQQWLGEYHVRSHAESFHSSIKRIFGIVTKRCGTAINTQVLCRIIHNNRRKTDYYLMADPAVIAGN